MAGLRDDTPGSSYLAVNYMVVSPFLRPGS
jgi:hypothetical protein